MGNAGLSCGRLHFCVRVAQRGHALVKVTSFPLLDPPGFEGPSFEAPSTSCCFQHAEAAVKIQAQPMLQRSDLFHYGHPPV